MTNWTSEVGDVTLGAIRIANAVILIIQMIQISGDEFVLSGANQCITGHTGDFLFLASMTCILCTVSQVLVLCLMVCIAVKHFCELRRHSTFHSSLKTHMSHFAILLAISCFHIGLFSPTVSVICQSVTDLYMRPRFIISTGHVFPGHKFILNSLKFSWSPRCLCWAHASSSAFENITLSS
ncbi:hypothetical protein BD769DRAFT_1401094 [Suillus cothurnatus]|nr:hypothetical protein BD769DRAFT_1401094 [Suillus cothurnatus]